MAGTRRLLRRRWLVRARLSMALAAATAVGLALPAVGHDTALAAAPPPTRSAPSSSGAPAPAGHAATPARGLTSLSGVSRDVIAQREAMFAAARQAKRTGEPVTAAALTTPTEVVTASPGGGFTMSARVAPVRTRVRDRWEPVDLRLSRDAAGRYVPAATAYGTVSLSGGGAGPLAATRSGGTSVAVSWPRALPAPTVSGATATYRNALPGVNLVLTATPAGGFAEVLVAPPGRAAWPRSTPTGPSGQPPPALGSPVAAASPPRRSASRHRPRGS